MRIAAIDVGTNSIHMIVCRIRPDLSFEVIDREKDMVRLGAGGLDGRRLAPSNIAVAMQTLVKFKRLADSHGVDEIIAAATSAVREAENGVDFLNAVRDQIGIRIRVISGTEEARLIHLAATYAIGVGAKKAIAIDIGGGSTEITLGTSVRMEVGRSFKLGVIRLTERFAKSDPLSGGDERRLVKYIRRDVRSYLRQLSKRGYHRVIGTSGTILALGALAADERPAPTEVRRVKVTDGSLRRLRERLVKSSLDARLKMPGLDPRRADLIVVGAVLLDTILRQLGAEELTLCDFALREGLVLDYMKKNVSHIRTVDRYPDARRRSIIELGERCGYRPEHARQVAKLAVALFDATSEVHGLGVREREWLEYAALLHDIGLHISYERHHKHSYYLIKHGDLRGFDPDEVEIMALVARYHRQTTPRRSHEGYGKLGRADRRRVRMLSALLRLAEGLDRSHAQAVSSLDIKQDGKAWVIRLKSTGDAELELWAATRHAAELASLLDTEIRFVTAGRRGAAKRQELSTNAQHAQHAARVSRPSVRGGRHRRIRQDHAARPARKVAVGKRA